MLRLLHKNYYYYCGCNSKRVSRLIIKLSYCLYSKNCNLRTFLSSVLEHVKLQYMREARHEICNYNNVPYVSYLEAFEEVRLRYSSQEKTGTVHEMLQG